MNNFIFGFGATITVKMDLIGRGEGTPDAFGFGLYSIDTENPLGADVSDEELKALSLGAAEDFDISKLHAVLWFRTREHRDVVSEAIKGKL